VNASPASATGRVAVTPVPTDEEAAAIVVALELLWPRPALVSAEPHAVAPWRFSARWWNGSVASRRARPFRSM
jgi:hypothetical protein